MPDGSSAASGRGILFVVATPIGNLADITLRALEILRTVPLVAAEDTRITRRLFERHAIPTRLVSYHAQSPERRADELVAHLEGGADLAIVTDAGTPGISDPGEELVRRWASAGGRVEPIPGPSAAVAAVSAVGIAGPRWAFEGFLPRSGAERRERLARIASDPRGTVLYEAPPRLAATLRDLAAAAGSDRAAAVARELTKRHEEIARGTLRSLADDVAAGRLAARGEIVVIVGEQRDVIAQRPQPSLEEARVAVERLVESGMPRGRATSRVAAETGIPRRRLYLAGDERGE